MLLDAMYLLLFSNFTDNDGIKLTTFSKIDCARACHEGRFSSFAFNPDINTCLAIKTRHWNTSGLTTAPGYQYYIMRPGYQYYIMRRDCDSNWTVFDGQCYQFGNTEVTASEAQARCAKLGGFLAKTDSLDDDVIIKSLQKKYQASFWLGASDEAQEGKWLWRDGTPVTLSLWATGQPDGKYRSDEDCTEQWLNKDGWNDVRCHSKKAYLCEK